MMPGPRKKLPPLPHLLPHSQTQTGQGSVGFLDGGQVALEAQTRSEANLALPEEEASSRWAQAFPASSSPALFLYSSVPTLQGTRQAGLAGLSPSLPLCSRPGSCALNIEVRMWQTARAGRVSSDATGSLPATADAVTS